MATTLNKWNKVKQADAALAQFLVSLGKYGKLAKVEVEILATKEKIKIR